MTKFHVHKKTPDDLKPKNTKSKATADSRRASDKKRASQIFSLLAGEYLDAKVALNFNSPFELLIATILSAQCTDARVNMVTPDLFRKYPSPKSFASANQAELERDIKSTGFYRQKARSITNCSRSLVENFGGKIPASMDELLTLAGVGRKTANVLLGNAFGIPGIAVDTHVGRLARRMGFSHEDDPTKIEFDLMALFPEDEWTQLCHLLMSHGRKVCLARNPKCDLCTVSDLCPSAFKFSKSKKTKVKKGK